jgi:hypothetical protein
MSHEQSTHILCDQEHCDEYYPDHFNEMGTHMTREDSHKEGWTSEGREDFCPRHSKKRAAEAAKASEETEVKEE